MRPRSRRVAPLLTAAVAVPILAATGCSQASGQQASPGTSMGSGASSPSGPPTAAPTGSSTAGTPPDASAAEEQKMAKKVQQAEKAADEADADAAKDPQ